MARCKEFDEEAVLASAVALFTRQGYNATSAQDLVDNLGISRSSLYDTYGDKRTLFIKALVKYREERTNELIAFIDQSDDVVKGIKHIFYKMQEAALHGELDKGCFILNSTIEMAPHDAEIAGIVNDNMQVVEDALYRALKRGQDDGQVNKSHSARALARFIFNNISGIRIAAKSGADKKVFDDIIRITLSILK
jgi:TetR/AcrR family transcriptional repressor of nem operon